MRATPIVSLDSIVSVSHTEAAIPRISRRFQADVERLEPSTKVILSNHCLDDSQKRLFQGGVYSW